MLLCNAHVLLECLGWCLVEPQPTIQRTTCTEDAARSSELIFTFWAEWSRGMQIWALVHLFLQPALPWGSGGLRLTTWQLWRKVNPALYNCSSTFVKDCVGCLSSDCLFRLVPHFIGTPTSPFALISMGFSQVSCYDRWLSCRAGHFPRKHV